MDFSGYPRSNVHYGGSEEKIGVVIEGINHIVKFQKESETGLMFNHFSEHIGSSIFKLLGEDAQATTLGTYAGRPVVICKDFTAKEEQYVPFNDVGDSSLEEDRETYQYSYDDIIRMLEENIKITNVQETIAKFWNMYIIDALLGNFDRHGANWGFIKRDNQYRMAPVFDNGSCLFPRIASDEQCLKIIGDEDEMRKRTLVFPTSQIKLNNRKSSYYEVISSLQYHECNLALKRVCERMRPDRIARFVRAVDVLSAIHKEFYIRILMYRYEHILKRSHERLVGVTR